MTRPLGRVGARLQLLEVGELADVDLRGQVTADRPLERLARIEAAPGERPAPGEGRAGTPPEQHLQTTFAHLEHHSDRLLQVAGMVQGRFSIHSRKLAKGRR